MGIYACPRCGNPNGWWSGNMRDIHDCPGPPPDTRKPWERSDWTCARARVDSEGMHCPEDKCADCPNRTRGVPVVQTTDDAADEVREFLASGLALDYALANGKVSERAVTAILTRGVAGTQGDQRG